MHLSIYYPTTPHLRGYSRGFDMKISPHHGIFDKQHCPTTGNLTLLPKGEGEGGGVVGQYIDRCITSAVCLPQKYLLNPPYITS